MTKIDELLYVAISLDIYLDANSAVEGRHDALSSPTEHGKVTSEACKKGLRKILELLDRHDVDATLFYEARTAHYLWAIFEGRRVSSDYLDAVLQARNAAKGGLFIFSIHPCHLCVDCQGNPFNEEQVKRNLKNLENILSQVKQMQGIQILRQDKYIENWLLKQISVSTMKYNNFARFS